MFKHAIALIICLASVASAQNTFTYQGTLDDSGAPANGSYDIQFRLYDHPTLDFDSLIASDTVLGIMVTDGLFSTQVDFGNNSYSTTQERYIELRVRPAGDPTYTILTPRQLMTNAPKAIRSQLADLAFAAESLILPINESDNLPSSLLRISNDNASGIGINGSGGNIGIIGSSTLGTGGRFFTTSNANNATALHGLFNATTPGSFSSAVRGEHTGTGSLGIGVYGSHDGSGWGVYGTSVSGLAGMFEGDVQVTGTLSKAGGSFKIDHPLDPENMYLFHSFVESPDMKNIYDGVAILDKQGQAIVSLPEYFDALNRDFRYQLTCVGGYAPVYIAAEIESSATGHQFSIAGGSPGLKVSWQVTGIRKDAWANQNRIPTEEMKEPENIGKYLNPELFNQPKEKGIGYIQSQTP